MECPNIIIITYATFNSTGKEGPAYITWDPFNEHSAPDEAGSTYRPAFIGLAHELAHAWDETNRITSGEVLAEAFDPKGNLVLLTSGERFAVEQENKIRREHQLPRRKYLAIDERGHGFFRVF
jgi:hypothetical protein